jgi:hypothetical protein
MIQHLINIKLHEDKLHQKNCIQSSLNTIIYRVFVEKEGELMKEKLIYCLLAFIDLIQHLSKGYNR